MVVVVLRVCRTGAGISMRIARSRARIHARNPWNAEQSRTVGLHCGGGGRKILHCYDKGRAERANVPRWRGGREATRFGELMRHHRLAARLPLAERAGLLA